jgi:hypothetical protein
LRTDGGTVVLPDDSFREVASSGNTQYRRPVAPRVAVTPARLASTTCVGQNLSDTIRAVQDIKFARSARKHRIGRAHALHVIHTTAYTRYPSTDDLDARIEWIGADDRSVELEIIAIELPNL